MYINDKLFEIKKVQAYFNYFIEINADENKSIVLNFKKKLDNIRLNEKINLNEYIQFDICFEDNDKYDLFYLNENSIVELIKIDDNKYKLNVDIKIEEKDRITTNNDHYSIETVKFDTEFNFIFDKPKYDIDPKIKRILDMDIKTPDNFFEVIGK